MNLPDLAERISTHDDLGLLPKHILALLEDRVDAAVTEMVFKGDTDVPMEIDVTRNLIDAVTADITQTPLSRNTSLKETHTSDTKSTGTTFWC